MNFPTLRSRLSKATCALAGIAMLSALSPAPALAQCAGCAQPTVAYSPVVAQQTPVYQTAYYGTGWYPGKFLGRVVTWPFRAVGNALTTPVAPAYGYAAPAVAPTFTTAAYRPTYPLSYSAGYTPYTASYAPVMQTVARPVALAPTYAYRPVTLAAVSDCCTPACSSPCGGCGTCSSCTGAVTAGYEAPIGSSCSNCGGQASQATYDYAAPRQQQQQFQSQPLPDNPSGSLQPTPAPGIDPDAPVSEQRLRPESAAPAQDGAGDDTTSWFEPPQLFDNRDRSAQRPTAPVWNAVYQKQNVAPQGRHQTAYRSASYDRPVAQPKPRHVQKGASGWQSARD